MDVNLLEAYLETKNMGQCKSGIQGYWIHTKED